MRDAAVSQRLDQRDVLAIAIADLAMQATGVSLLSAQRIVAAARPVAAVCGVYFLVRDGSVIYAGPSTNVVARVGQHLPVKRFDAVAFTGVGIHRR